MNDKVAYWLNIADYDLQTAKAMLQSSRFLYVGFMCHQSIQKALKAAIARICAENEIPPKVHDLLKLAIKAKLYSEMSEDQKDFIDSLNPLNIEARYPDYKIDIESSFSKEVCDRLINRTEELLCWIKERL